jgi:DNA-binding XRE family transcriptional regulator
VSKHQIIYQDGKPAFAVVPWADYKRLARPGKDGVPDAGDAGDLAAVRAAKARVAAGERTIPGAVVFAIARGAHPVAAWRKHRKMSQAALGAASGVNPAHLSQIETGHRNASLATLERLAAPLDTDRENLLPPKIERGGFR